MEGDVIPRSEGTFVTIMDQSFLSVCVFLVLHYDNVTTLTPSHVHTLIHIHSGIFANNCSTLRPMNIDVNEMIKEKERGQGGGVELKEPKIEGDAGAAVGMDLATTIFPIPTNSSNKTHKNKSIVILTPYRAQKQLIEQLLRKAFNSEANEDITDGLDMARNETNFSFSQQGIEVRRKI